MLQILHYPHPTLARVAEPIATIDDSIRALAQEMVPTMYQYEGIGLAAPQVGHSLRLIIVDITGRDSRDGLMTLINPVLTPQLDSTGEKYCETEEGCLSIPEYLAKVRRAAAVHVQGLDLDGNPLDFVAEGMLAVCLQHEVDHLNGKLFIDHISYLKRTLFDTRLRKQASRA